MLPTGTVTFLLTDVEGSTTLWEDAPEEMCAALARHDALFEQVVQAHNGIHIRPRGEGDSRFAVFPTATDAVAAALAIQRAFGAEAWLTPRPIAVRIGIHTGEAELRDGDYYGSTVNRCARLRGIGHGGQTLLSEATAALVRDDLPGAVSLLDLGLHRLRDLARAEQVTQLSANDLPAAFPPLTSLDARPHNLPVQTTSLVGRERELAQVRELLRQDEIRLLTLTGPGGTGKTRLGLQLAADSLDDFRDGVYVVDLAPISDPSLIAATIAPVLGVVERGEHVLDDLKRFLRSRSLLLVLDNFEQILPAAPVVGELLTASADLKILVTSRAALQVRGEHQVEIPPLAVPDLASTQTQALSVEVLQQYPAVALFVERARAVRTDFALTAENGPAVAAICARLDGLPLALELAAARSRLLPPEAMVRRLEQRLPLLTGGARDLPARQRTLRDTIAWSYDLLDPDEQRTFRGLGVFVGGFTLEAAESVIGGDEPPFDVLGAVERLVTQSLVRADRGDGPEPRCRMLETIREFALDRLGAQEETASLRDRHLRWFTACAEQAGVSSAGVDQAARLSKLDDEFDNMRAAMRWAERSGDSNGRGLRLASSLGQNFWAMRGYHREGRAWLDRLLTHAQARTAGRAEALRTSGRLALRQNDYPAASTLFDEALEIFREIGDRRGIAQTLSWYGVVPHHLGQHDAAQAMLEESLAMSRELGIVSEQSIALRFLADLAQDRGDYPRAALRYEETLALSRERQVPHDIAYALRGLGHLARAQGRYDRARDLLRESLALLKPLNDRRCIPLTLEGLACITAGDGWAERAARLLGAAQAMQAKTGAPSPPSSAADYQRTVVDARKALGDARFELTWAEGSAMGLTEAVDLALAPPRETVRDPAQTTTAAVIDRPHHPVVPLSPREREVVTLIAQGRSNREIAESLVLSVRTVERHIENVYNRLGISGKAGRAIVTAYALRHGIATPA